MAGLVHVFARKRGSGGAKRDFTFSSALNKIFCHLVAHKQESRCGVELYIRPLLLYLTDSFQGTIFVEAAVAERQAPSIRRSHLPQDVTELARR